MRAMQFDHFGDAVPIRRVEVPRPVPGRGQILVRMTSTSVNPVDLMIRRGIYASVGSRMLPYTGGRDAAGTVEGIGEGVGTDWLGQQVFGLPEMDRGTFADHVVLNLSEAAVAPPSADPQDLGSLPLAALTAWQGLHVHGQIQPGQRVLIQGASGGVGHLAVQIAKAAGATVHATASHRNLAFLDALGADVPIAYDRADPAACAKAFDLVLDVVGGAPLARSLAAVRPGGCVISAVEAPEASAIAAAGIGKGAFFISTSSGADLARIATLIEAGQLKVAISRRFDLEETSIAQRLLEGGGIPGKIAISIA